jgi:hypothetical protein
MRIKHTVLVKIGDDPEMKDLLFGPDETLAQVVTDKYTKETSGKVSVVGGETETIDFGDITAVKGVYLKVNAECGIKINGGSAIQLRKSLDTTAGLAKFFIEADISSLQIVAAADTPVSGIFCAWGDASA